MKAKFEQDGERIILNVSPENNDEGLLLWKFLQQESIRVTGQEDSGFHDGCNRVTFGPEVLE